MLWHVHGTDASTGQPVILSVENSAPTQAVQTALGKRILVSRVVRATGLAAWFDRTTLHNALLPLLAAAVALLAPLCYGLYTMNQIERARSAALAIQPAPSLAPLTATSLPAPTLPAPELAAQRQRAATLQSQLDSLQLEILHARARIADLEPAAARAPALQSDLDSARKKLQQAPSASTDLTRQIAAQKQRLADLQNRAAKTLPLVDTQQKLLAANAQLTAQIDLLKTQLLELAAQPAPDSSHASLTPVTAPADIWALSIPRDTALDFVSLHFGKEAFTRPTTATGIRTLKALHPQNACAVALKIDATRIYLAALSVSLAPEAPPEKIAENTQLLAAFAHTFAPEWKNPDEWLLASIKSLAAKKSAERLLLLGNQFQATLSHDDLHQFTLRIESPRSSLED